MEWRATYDEAPGFALNPVNFSLYFPEVTYVDPTTHQDTATSQPHTA